MNKASRWGLFPLALHVCTAVGDAQGVCSSFACFWGHNFKSLTTICTIREIIRCLYRGGWWQQESHEARLDCCIPLVDCDNAIVVQIDLAETDATGLYNETLLDCCIPLVVCDNATVVRIDLAEKGMPQSTPLWDHAADIDWVNANLVQFCDFPSTALLLPTRSASATLSATRTTTRSTTHIAVFYAR